MSAGPLIVSCSTQKTHDDWFSTCKCWCAVSLRRAKQASEEMVRETLKREHPIDHHRYLKE